MSSTAEDQNMENFRSKIFPMKNSFEKTLKVVLIIALCFTGVVFAQTEPSNCKQPQTNENVTPIVALISFLGVIISLLVSLKISEASHKIYSKKIHYEFIRELNSMRLKAYFEIYELVSGFIKVIESKGISYKRLNDFYEKYSDIDSKLSLLFAKDALDSSWNLINRLRKEITNQENNDLPVCEELKAELVDMLAKVEDSMRKELKTLENV